MNFLIAKLLGLDARQFAGAKWSELSVRFQGLPAGAAGWWALATLAGVAGLVWLTIRNYRRESDSASLRMKALLSALRLGALGLVILVLFQPTLVIDKSKHLPSTLVVLVDDSLSMGLEDHYADADFMRRLALGLEINPPEKIRTMTRLEIVRAMLEKNDNTWLKELARHHHLKVFSFAEAIQELKTAEPAGADALPQRFFDVSQLQATGAATDIEGGLRRALEGVQGQPLAAVILLTDGQANTGEALAAAQTLAARNIPVFSVGIGSAEPPRNIEVLSLSANNVIFKDDEAVFTVQVTARGFEGRVVPLTLKAREQNGGASEVVATQSVTLGADGAIQEIALHARPARVGVFAFSAEIEPQAGELTDKDNSASLAIRVIDQKVRVLMVAGDSGREYRYLKNYLIRDKTIAARVWLENASPEFVQESSAGEPPLAKLPREEADLFAYDVVILSDPMPRDCDGAWAKLLQKFVGDRGGGLCFLAGRKYTEDFLFTRDFEPIAAVLPVTIARDSLAFREGISRINLQQWPMVLTSQGLDHPALQLDVDPERNRNLWAVMPGFYWSQPVARAKPGATVLAVHFDPRRATSEGAMPVMAAQFYGAGRTFFMGMDETWRWRFVGAKYFEQFWNQTVRYLSQGRLLGGRKRVEFLTDRETYNLGQRALLTAKVFAPDYTPAKLANFAVEVRGESGVKIPVTLTPLPGAPGQFEAAILLAKTGLYEIVPRTDDSQLLEHAGTKNFRVILPRLEFQQPRMNAALLADLARVTGGKLVAADEFAKLPSLVPAREQIILNEITQDLWDAPLILLLFCVLLFAEWSLRKWKNMA